MKRLIFFCLLFLSGCAKDSVWENAISIFKPTPKKHVVDTVVKVKEAKELEVIDYDEV